MPAACVSRSSFMTLVCLSDDRRRFPQRIFVGPENASVETCFQLLWEIPMDLASLFAWFAQESISIAEQANEPERRDLHSVGAALGTAAQQCSGGAPAMQSKPAPA